MERERLTGKWGDREGGCQIGRWRKLVGREEGK